MNRVSRLFVALGLLAVAGTPVTMVSAVQAPGSGEIAGPILARVERVIDGDTIVVRAFVWPGQEVITAVRIMGIDAPEIRARCEAERTKARDARLFLERWLTNADVELRHVKLGKYAGRVVARVNDTQGRDLSTRMIETGHAVPYVKRGAKAWCPGRTG